MKLDKIKTDWKIDNDIDIDISDPSKIISEIKRISNLHSKYSEELTNTKLDLLKAEVELDKITIEKWKLYADGIQSKPLTHEQIEYCPKGNVTKPEAEKYMKGDVEYQQVSSKAEYLNIKKQYLEEILKKLHSTTYYINNITSLILHFNGKA